MEKIKSSVSLRRAVQHNTRERMPPNADESRTATNWTSGGSVADVMGRYSHLLPDKVRRNAVHAVELMMTASPEFAGNWKGYMDACDKWASSLFGKENVLSVAHHMDESTPHTQILIMPLKDGKLNAKHFIGGSRDRMTELQTDFFEKVGKQFKLERGQPKQQTRARHSHHTLAGKTAELETRAAALDEREKAVAGREVKQSQAEQIVKDLMKIPPLEIKKKLGLLDAWENKTAPELYATADNLRSKGYRNTKELQQGEERKINQGHKSISR
jgi:hypothetical protein